MTTTTAAQQPRRALPSRIVASNTIERPSAHLDARSAAALEFCTFFLRRHASITAPPAVLIRRGLQLLAEHLSALEADDIAREVHLIRDTGNGSGSALSLTEARARIEDHLRAPAAQPMGHWLDALHSQQERKNTADMLARVDAAMGRLDDTGALA